MWSVCTVITCLYQEEVTGSCLVLSTRAVHFVGYCLSDKFVQAQASGRCIGPDCLLFTFMNAHLDLVVGLCIIFGLGRRGSFSAHRITTCHFLMWYSITQITNWVQYARRTKAHAKLCALYQLRTGYSMRYDIGRRENRQMRKEKKYVYERNGLQGGEAQGTGGAAGGG